jgi:lambda family phage portal protein
MKWGFHIGKFAVGYDAGDSVRMRQDLGWGRSTPRDEDNAVADGSLETIRQKAADLRRNNPIIAGVCDRLASWTVGTGIVPQAKTTDKEWNKAAEQFWSRWSATCDVRGRSSLWHLQWLAVSLRPTHGGLYFEMLDNGQIRPIECERIRQPQKGEQSKNYTEGVRVDLTTGQVVDYCVHARAKDGTFSAGHDERFIARENILPVVRPAWRADQVREVPDLAPMIPALQDLAEANKYQLSTFKTQSQVIAALKKGGAVGTTLPRGTTTPTVGQRQTFKAEWGQIMQLNPGEDLDMKVSPTPGPQHIPYIRLQLALAAPCLDVPYEWFALDFTTADFSRQKAIMLLANKALRNWRAWLNESMNSQLWNWRIPMAMKQGDLPAAPTEQRNGFEVSTWDRVEWQAPEEPWTDRQESNQADMLEWQMGLVPLSVAAKRRGGDLEDRLRQKAEDLKMAAEIEAEYGLPPDTLIKAQIPGQTGNQSVPPEPKGATNGNAE